MNNEFIKKGLIPPVGNVDAVMDGDLDGFVESYLKN